jgi:YT521-B-like domain
MELKDHFSRNATDDIGSVFLISKSNCAFINYRNEESCTSALTRFHDSRFKGAKLVCRLRKASTAPPAGTPTGPRTSLVTSAPNQIAGAIDDGQMRTPTHEDVENPETTARKVEEKFFVLKSLTIEDLAASVLNGSWATQSHNEAALNSAYKVSNLITSEDIGLQAVVCQQCLSRVLSK